MTSIKGVGLGIRQPHFVDILETKPEVPWFEALADNYQATGGLALRQLEAIRAHYPMALHCVGMNLGSTDPLDWEYLRRIKTLAKRFGAAWISDHLCWTSVSARHHHDLLPLPYTEEAIRHVADRIAAVQDSLRQQILIENVSSYIAFQHSEMPEWEFLRQVADRADCLILLDLNNVYVNSVNHQFSPLDYVHALPKSRVRQFHLAGYMEDEYVLIDTHGSDITKDVWYFYQDALKIFGPVPTIIERDNAIPELGKLLVEMNQAKDRMGAWN